MRGRVAVALSGGVDSAVAAARTIDAGFEVIAVHGKEWNAAWAGSCPAEADVAAARSAAEYLGIPLTVVPCERTYREAVLEPFLEGLVAGTTPNPDVTCNRTIKFGVLAGTAQALGASALVTGHYARVQPVRGTIQLHVGVDPAKDQSYFLSTLTEEQLGFARFPLGGSTKAEVREEARRRGLPVADRPDSMGLCFVGAERFSAFLGTFVPERRGTVIDVHGSVLGEHRGTEFYTIGQRHGLELSGGPYYVAGKDPVRHTLTVVRGREHPRLLSSSVRMESVHWIHGAPPPGSYRVRFRHQQPLTEAWVAPEGNGASVRFRHPAWAATPGQVLAVYTGSRVLGGGPISEATP